MTKKEIQRKKIDSLYNILIQFEKIGEDGATFDTYHRYLKNLYIKFVGYGDIEVSKYLNGLWQVGEEITHETLRQIVFNMISLIEENR